MGEVTTTANLKGSHGQYCALCKVKKPVGRLSSKGFVCTDCDWKPLLVSVPEPEPAEAPADKPE